MRVSDVEKIRGAVKALTPEAVSLLQALVRVPSENHPPRGDELAVQKLYREWLTRHGIAAELCFPADIPGFASSPARLPERDMTDRPNVVATVPGTGSGRSLLVLAHADTMPAGPREAWNDGPFDGVIRDGFLYGLGSGDDKCGMAIAAMLPLVSRATGIRPAGDLTVASVADEENGGGNGVAALLASGVRADAAVYLDGSNQTVWNVGLGGGFAEVVVTAESRRRLKALIERAKPVILSLKAERKRAIIESPAFGEAFFQETMAGFFDIRECSEGALKATLTFVLDTLPGDDEAALKRRVETALSAVSETIRVEWMSRFLKPVPLLPESHPLVAALGRAFETAAGRGVKVGPGRQSDQGLVSHFGAMPCVLFGCGRRGRDGAPHQPNESVSLREFEENLLTMAIFALTVWR